MMLNVSDIIGSNSATIRDQGLAVYELAKAEIERGKSVSISFDGIDIVISSFLNASIGKLYGDFPFKDIDTKVTITGLDSNDMELLEVTVIPNAKEFYSDREHIENIEQSAIESK